MCQIFPLIKYFYLRSFTFKSRDESIKMFQNLGSSKTRNKHTKYDENFERFQISATVTSAIATTIQGLVNFEFQCNSLGRILNIDIQIG